MDPRVDVGRANGHLTLRMGEPREWVDRASTLADPDRMEAALLALRAACLNWGEADIVLREFLGSLRERLREGRISEGAWRAVRRSLVRGVLRAAGRLRPRIGAPVALLASPADATSDALVALAETVMRERGYTVIEVGCSTEPAVLEQVIDEQQPHVAVLLAGRQPAGAGLVPRVDGAARAAARGGVELWLVGGADWPEIDGARVLPTLVDLAEAAGRGHGQGGGVRTEPIARGG